MTDDQSEVRHINWGEVFAFTRIFKSFKMAIHPSKLLLALAAIILVCAAGWFMDWLWGACGQTVRDGELVAHATMGETAFDEAMRRANDDERLLQAAAKLQADNLKEWWSLSNFTAEVRQLSPRLEAPLKEKIKKQNEGDLKDKKPKPDDVSSAKIVENAKKKDVSWSTVLGKAKDAHDEMMDRIDDLWSDVVEAAEKKLDEAKVGENEAFKTEEEKEEAQRDLDRAIARAPQIVTKTKMKFREEVRKIEGSPIVGTLIQWERRCIWNGIMAVRYGNFTGGMTQYRQMLRNRAMPSDDQVAAGQAPNVPAPPARLDPQGNTLGEPVPANQRGGAAYWLLMALHGLCWFIQEHWLYAAIFLVFCLAVWSLFGGAIHRIAALQAAREEKISMGQSLRFAMDKFLSFFSAPLIPAILLFIVGLFLFLGGLLGNIPWVGPILMGVPFVLAIVGGVVMAFLAIALAGGIGLMYPTIAVEGSDSFDAISRSISYIFQRPWHALLYAVATAVYGVITFLFVRFFAFVAVSLTHWFVSLGVMRGGGRLDINADELDVLWQAPTWENFDNLSFAQMVNTGAMTNTGQLIGSVFIWIWVALFLGLMIAYLPSFLASSTTVVYYLLRQKVDATDLDDVYVEEAEEEEEFEEELPGGEEAEAGEAGEEQPAEEEPAEEEKPPEEDKPSEEAEPSEEDKGEGEEDKSE